MTRESTEAAADEPPPSLLGRSTVLAAALLVVLGVGIGAGWFMRPVPVTDPVSEALLFGDDKSIAVLPFADFSPGGDPAWFSDVWAGLDIRFDLAIAFARAGDPQRALHHLEAVAAIAGPASYLRFSIQPGLDSLPQQPRWLALKGSYERWAEGR